MLSKVSAVRRFLSRLFVVRRTCWTTARFHLSGPRSDVSIITVLFPFLCSNCCTGISPRAIAGRVDSLQDSQSAPAVLGPAVSVASRCLRNQSKALAKIKHTLLDNLAEQSTLFIENRPNSVLDDRSRQRSQSRVIDGGAGGVGLCLGRPRISHVDLEHGCFKFFGCRRRPLKVHCSGRAPIVQDRA
jgi:hypothetical protein